MIIGKLTVLSFIMTGICYFAVWVWEVSDEKRAALTSLTLKYPKRLYLMLLFIFFDVIGVFASVIHLLFVR